MSDGTVDVEIANRVAVISLNRPSKRNALSVTLLGKLVASVDAANKNDGVDVLILTGSDPAFCAGLDLAEVSASGGALSQVGGSRTSSPWSRLTKPLIGAINGAAVTAGFELALQCDFLIASERATFADTHVAVGVMPAGGLSVLLPDRIGFPRAIELSLTGRVIGATEASRLGLVNHVVPHDELLSTARAVALTIVERDQRAVRTLLASFGRIANAPGREAALASERATAEKWLASFDPTAVVGRRDAVTECLSD